MKNNIFEITGQSFFAPLASKNKLIHWFIIDTLYQYIKDSNQTQLGVPKNEAISLLTEKLSQEQFFVEYFEEEVQNNFEEPENEEDYFELDNSLPYSGTDRTKAAVQESLKYLRKCKWLDIATDINYENPQYIFTLPASQIINTLIIVSNKPETRRPMYQAYAIVNSSLSADAEKASENQAEMLQYAATNITTTSLNLKALNTNIEALTDKLKNNAKTPKEALDQYSEFSKQIVQDSFHNMNTRDNIKLFSAPIQKKLEELQLNETWLERTSKQWLSLNGIPDTPISRNDAESAIFLTIREIIEQLDMMPSISQEINMKVARYLSITKKRVGWLFSSRQGMLLEISAIVRALATGKTETDLPLPPSLLLSLTNRTFSWQTKTIDSESLDPLIPNQKNINTKNMSPIKQKTASPAEKQQAKKACESMHFKAMKRKQMADKKIIEALKKKSILTPEDLPISTTAEYADLIYVAHHGSPHSRNTPYIYLPVPGKTIEHSSSNYKFNDFSIQKRSFKKGDLLNVQRNN